jgi:TrmH family RNA methyltransferase
MKVLTLARDLRRRKARERQGLFVVEGIRAVEELLRARVPVRGALVAPQLDATPRGAALRDALAAAGVTPLEVSDAELASAADTDAPQGVVVVAEQPRRTLADLSPAPAARYLVLDGLQDPGNAGTLLRTAAALGATATLALPGTVDLWSAKVVRSAMGAAFHHPTVSCTWDDLAAFLARAGAPLWGADGAGEPVAAAAADPPSRLAVAIGNEGAGLSAGVRAHAARLVAVPTTGLVESLNAAVAAAIVLYELRPPTLRG